MTEFIHSSIGKHLGCVCLVARVTSDAMNMSMHVHTNTCHLPAFCTLHILRVDL